MKDSKELIEELVKCFGNDNLCNTCSKKDYESKALEIFDNIKDVKIEHSKQTNEICKLFESKINTKITLKELQDIITKKYDDSKNYFLDFKYHLLLNPTFALKNYHNYYGCDDYDDSEKINKIEDGSLRIYTSYDINSFKSALKSALNSIEEIFDCSDDYDNEYFLSKLLSKLLYYEKAIIRKVEYHDDTYYSAKQIDLKKMFK